MYRQRAERVSPIVLRSVKKAWTNSTQCFKRQQLSFCSGEAQDYGLLVSLRILLQTFCMMLGRFPVALHFRTCPVNLAQHHVLEVRLWINCRGWIQKHQCWLLGRQFSLGSNMTSYVQHVICHMNLDAQVSGDV